MARAPRGTKQRMVRLTDEEWAKLTEIAAREGLSYGGQPSPAEAIRWMIARDQDGATAERPGPADQGEP